MQIDVPGVGGATGAGEGTVKVTSTFTVDPLIEFTVTVIVFPVPPALSC